MASTVGQEPCSQVTLAEEIICGPYSSRQHLVNTLSSFLRHLASYEAIVCFVIMKFFLRVSNTS